MLSAEIFLAVPSTYSFTQNNSTIQVKWNFEGLNEIETLWIGYDCNIPGYKAVSITE